MKRPVDARTLRSARADGRAIIGFSIYNLEQGLGVIRAAESAGTPVLLQAGSSAFRYTGREPLARLALGLAEASGVPVGIHLDHSTEVEEIEACLRLGYTSVMYDGSAFDLETNIRITREVVSLAHAAGAWVEAELVGIAGGEDESTAAEASGLTDPDTAARFVAATEVDALAVAVGNVHGMTSADVALDLARLADIADAVSIPLVLHGASGLPEAQVVAAIDLGVAKLNINSELRRAYREALVDATVTAPLSDGIAALMTPAISAVQRVAEEKLRLFTAARPAAATLTARNDIED